MEILKIIQVNHVCNIVMSDFIQIYPQHHYSVLCVNHLVAPVEVYHNVYHAKLIIIIMHKILVALKRVLQAIIRIYQIAVNVIHLVGHV
jgi:hypothetical protein